MVTTKVVASAFAAIPRIVVAGSGRARPTARHGDAGFIAGIDPTGTCRPHSFRDMSIGHNVIDWLAIPAQPARSPMLAAILTGHYLAVDDRNDDLRLRIGRLQARSSRSFPSALPPQQRSAHCRRW